MIPTDLYVFTRKQGCKSKYRLDCTASTGGYPPFEQLRNKARELFLYLGDSSHVKAKNGRQADLSISNGIHISCIFCPDVEQPYGYGDFKGTNDALLFVLHDVSIVDGVVQEGAWLEVIVARGMRNNRVALFNLLLDGELDEELARIRSLCVPERPND